MRIAFSGAHAVGKSTLIADLAALRSDYEVVDEPYHHLAAEGVLFSASPSVPDFEIQLERSVALLGSRSTTSAFFDRCPADYLAYLHVLSRRDHRVLSRWLRESTGALATLDLVVFVPVERPDRISVPSDELPTLRKHVNRALTRILLEDELGLGLDVIQVAGPPSTRANQVLEHLR